MNRIFLILLILFSTAFAVVANDRVYTPIDVSDGLSDNQIRYILQLPDGRMVFTTSGNINLYDGSHFTYVHRTSEHIYPLNKYNGFYRIYQGRDSLLWIKEMNKLLCLDLLSEKYISNIDSLLKARGIETSIDDFFVDKKQRIWLLTNKGLLNHDSFEFFNTSTNKGELQDLAADTDNLFLFYNTGEVICYDIKTRERKYSTSAYPSEEHEKFKSTSLVVEGNDGFYQLRNGTKGGFFFFDPSNHMWRKILETDYAFNTLIVTPDETAYISCIHGVWAINLRKNISNYYPDFKTVEGDVIDTEISTLFNDSQGGLWLGTFNRGLLYYHPAKYKFNHIGRTYFPQLSSRDIVIHAFGEDSDGSIYIKGNSQIYKYTTSSTDDKKLTPIPEHLLDDETLNTIHRQPTLEYNGNNYTALCKDTRGWVWAGTQDGLMLITPTQERIFYTEHGLANNFVQAILEDSQHNIWITTSYGISKIQVDSLTEKIHFTNFGMRDGTLKGEYTGGSIFESSDGTIYFGGVNGFNTLHPQQLILPELPFKPIFTNLFLRGEKVIHRVEYGNRTILHTAPPYANKVELSYNQNFLTFEFSALNYINQFQTHYRYKLEGIDSDWHDTSFGEGIETDATLRASYTNLPAGKYTLRVMSSNSNLQWDGQETTVDIIIHAPWWKTATAYCIYSILFILIISGSIYLYIYSTKKKIERQHKEEILLLRIKNLIEQRNEYEAGQKLSPEDDDKNSTLDLHERNDLTSADSAFLTKAIEFVEKNLDEPTYTVEQLSNDLCMDRTGLYRKLIALLDKSPSLFIRNIRLQRASQLILEGELSIAEIADRVGFSSASYFSKCFQQMYGCRPSEYAKRGINQQ